MPRRQHRRFTGDPVTVADTKSMGNLCPVVGYFFFYLETALLNLGE